jgi:hypothetical protein
MFKDEIILVKLVSYELEICVCFTNQLVKFWGKIKIRVYFLREEVHHVWIFEKCNLEEEEEHHFSCSMVKEE